METRDVSTKIPLSEVPFVMRAMGFYPSEQEVIFKRNIYTNKGDNSIRIVLLPF